MSRTLRWVGVVIVVQAALIGGYWLVERQRAAQSEGGAGLSTQPPQKVNMSFPTLAVRGRDGAAVRLSAPSRPTLLHIWATWCPPCRQELPKLSALSETEDLKVVLVALDADWKSVDPHLDATSRVENYLGNGSEVRASFGVRTLPATFLVQPHGRITLRFDGARDWGDRAFLKTWQHELGDK